MLNAPATTTNIELSGPWSFAYTVEPPAVPPHMIADLESAGLPLLPCTVPGNFELDLHTVGLIEEPFHGMNIAGLRWCERAHVWYARRFTARRQAGHEAEIVFEGIDCFADIYLDGARIASTGNMLVEHVVPVEKYLTDQDNEYELVVHIRPAVEEAKRYEYPPGIGGQHGGWEGLYVRKAPHMFGWDIMPRAVSAGLWRPVTLRYRPVERIETVFLRTLRTEGERRPAQVALYYRVRAGDLTATTYEIEVEGQCGERTFAARHRVLFEAGKLPITVAEAALWWPRGRGDANLYDVTVRLLRDGVVIDEAAFRFGVRTVELDRTSVTDAAGSGEFCFKINGEKVFVLGSNWVPADAFHSRDRARIPGMVALAEEIGCNLLRCWGGNVYEDDLFYDLCDTQGIMVWQDFAMACGVYPQDTAFQDVIRREATKVVRRLRNHPCIVLWAGDNECDESYGWHSMGDPNNNVLTRKVLPEVLRAEDPSRPYLPSSPYIDSTAYSTGVALPENHLWGPRDYFKSDFYKNSLCHFASEMGYHGSPSPTSIRKFISPDKVWPNTDNDEWILHSTSPMPGVNLYDYRVELMNKQVRELFGTVPLDLEDWAFASQASQAEAKKLFVEMFRAAKWRRTGIIWWNLIDGWPQFSDAVVDYYGERKLAFGFLQRAQRPVTLILREPANWGQDLVAVNDTRTDASLAYTVRDVDTGEVLAEGSAVATGDAVTVLSRLPFTMAAQRFYVLEWNVGESSFRSHYLAGLPPFDLARYRGWLQAAEL
jgi:beta-mannosidase